MNEYASDHDLLIELKSEIRSLREVIEKLTTGTQTSIDDHETRIRTLERWGSLLLGGLYIANVVIGYYLLTRH